MGSQLGGVLQGAIDPLQLVFPQGDLTTATQLYQDSSTAKVMNTIVQQVITQAIEKLPLSRGIRLLEIGAGTGGTTSYILPHLNSNQAEYLFTDIGALFTAKGQEKFPDYRFLRYQTLDIEVDPKTQGFESHHYDVIIAANVIHATTSIKQTLSHVRQLLAPGGILVLYEATTRTKWLDLVFGLLAGWWKFQDDELRPDYPLLNRFQWKKVLSETGFNQVVTLPEMEDIPDILSEQAVIVAQASPATESTVSISKGWLLLADGQGLAQQLARQLNSWGDVCILVFPGEKYQQIAPVEFTINPNNPSEYEQLLRTVITQLPSLYGVVQCWSTESGISKTIDSDALANLSKLGCGSTLSLVQALVKGGLSQPPRLWLVTTGAQPVPANHPVIPGVAQSSLWGMGKVISLEHPELNCTRIDLDPHPTKENQVLQLFQEIWSEDREDQVAWRGNARYVARLVASRHRQAKQQQIIPSQPFPLETSQNWPVNQTTEQADVFNENFLSFREDATYLITGGLAGLGLLVAQWMVSKGARNLVLVGRRLPDEASQKKLMELEMTGAAVVVEQADVSDIIEITRVIRNIENSNIPLAGIIHSAGMLSDGVLLNQTWSSFEQVMAPKVQGAWYLHQLTQHQPLDFFVLFSSVTSLLGYPGQGNHAAANAFLDGLAHYRLALGLSGLSLHLGAVSQVGEAAQRGADARAFQHGMGVISPAQFLESLELLMSNTTKPEGNFSNVEVGVVSIYWSDWQERIIKWSFLSDWQDITQTKVVHPQGFIEKLRRTDESNPYPQILSQVHEIAAQVLRYPILKISIHEPLTRMGMDSLMAIEIRNSINALGFSISLEAILTGLCIEDLANEIVIQLNESTTKANNFQHNNYDSNIEDSNADSDYPRSSPTFPSHTPSTTATVSSPSSPNPWIVVPKANANASIRLICFPYGGGGPVVYFRWSDELSNDIELGIIHLPGRGNRLNEDRFVRMEDLVNEITPALIPFLQEKPFAFFGHCIGAIQMFEVTHKLQREYGVIPHCLFVSGARAPQFYNPEQMDVDIKQISPNPNIPSHRLPDHQLLEIAKDLNFGTSEALFNDQEMRQLMLPTFRSDLEINNTYNYVTKPPLDIPILAVGGQH